MVADARCDAVDDVDDVQSKTGSRRLRLTSNETDPYSTLPMFVLAMATIVGG